MQLRSHLELVLLPQSCHDSEISFDISDPTAPGLLLLLSIQPLHYWSSLSRTIQLAPSLYTCLLHWPFSLTDYQKFINYLKAPEATKEVTEMDEQEERKEMELSDLKW